MKILLVSTGSGSRGGGEVYLLLLSGILSRMGHEVHILLPSHPRMDEMAARYPSSVKVHRIHLKNTYDRLLRQIGAVLDTGAQLTCRKFITELAPDIVHINQQVAEDGLDVLLAVHPLKISCVLTIHITHSAKSLGARFGWIRDLITERIVSHTEFEIITISNEMRRLLDERLGGKGVDRIHMIYNGVSCPESIDSETRNKIRSSWGVQDSMPVIGIVGRIDAQKNPFFFLNLLAGLKTGKCLYKAVWVGDGKLRYDLQQRSHDLGVSDHFHIDGWMDEIEVKKRLHAMDIFVLPSRFEGLPIALQEAMCSGLPVCVSDVDGMREAVLDGENGYLCRPDDLDEWLDKMSGLLGDANKRKIMGERGKQIAQERFSPAVMAAATLAVYEQSIERRRLKT